MEISKNLRYMGSQNFYALFKIVTFQKGFLIKDRVLSVRRQPKQFFYQKF